MNTMQHLPSLISIENGRKVPHTFSPEEYARRHGLLRIHMAEAGIDAQPQQTTSSRRGRGNLDIG